MKIKFEEDSLQYKLWCEIVNDVYLEFDTTNDASKADDLINKIERLLNLVMPNEVLAGGRLAESVRKFRNLKLLENLSKLRGTKEYIELVDAWDNYTGKN